MNTDKSHGMFLLLLGIGVVLSPLAEAQPSAPSELQGEWLSDDGDRATGISIGECDDQGRCKVKTFQSGGTTVSCLRQGTTAPADTPGQFVAVIPPPGPSWAKFETPCTLRLSKDGDRLVSQRTDQGENTCQMQTCEPVKATEKKTYRLLSQENFLSLPGGNGDECYGMPSKSVSILCTDKALHELLASVKDIPFVATGWSWFVDSQLFAKCDSSDNTRDCLDQAYRAKIAVLKEESAKLWSSYGEDGNPAEAKAKLDKMTGVYKRRFKNEYMSGDTYESEDVFEFVPISDSAAYLKMYLNFFNGHRCSIAGVAEYKKVGGFVFQDDDDAVLDQCLLTVTLTGDKIDFTDPTGSCQKFCGTRGRFSNKGFELNRRRTIRYMPIILGSKDYTTAIEAYESATRNSPEGPPNRPEQGKSCFGSTLAEVRTRRKVRCCSSRFRNRTVPSRPNWAEPE